MEWRVIPGFDSYYRINEFGEVQSCARKGRPYGKTTIWKTLKPNGSCIRLRVNLTAGLGKAQNHHYTHRLVWISFVGEIPPGFVLDHIDRDPRNNNLTNLRLANLSQNQWNRNKELEK